LVESPPIEPEIAPPPMRRRGWRLRHAAGAGLSLALLALICVFGALVVILAVGRLNLDLLKPALVATLNQRLGPAYRLDISNLAIERQNHGLALALKDFAISRSDGRKLVTAPKADLIFDPLSLFGGQFRPSRVELEDLHVELHVLPDGGVDLSAGESGAPEEKPAENRPLPQISVAAPTSAPTAPRAKIIRQAATAINSIFDVASSGDSPFAALDHFGVSRGSLVIDDQVAGQKRGFQDFEFSLDRSRAGGREAADMKMSALGPSGRWNVHASAHGARSEAHDLSFEASGFSIDEIALLAGKTSLPVDSDIPISFKAAASFEGGGHVAEANARIELGSGFWRFDDPDFAPVFVDEIFAAAHWDGANHRALVDEAQIFSGETRFFINGAVTPPPTDGAPWSIVFKQTEPCVIGPDRAGEKPFFISSFHGELGVDPASKILTIGRTEMVGPEVAAAAQGSFDWVSGPHLRLGVAAGKTSAGGVLALWPNVAGAPARGWLGDHLIGGTLESLRLALDFDETDLRMMRAQHAPMSDRITVDYTVKDAAFSFIDGAPPVTGVNGVGHSSGRATRLSANTGAMEAVAGRRIDFNNGVISFPDVSQKPPEMIVSARGKGSLDALGELLAKPGFARVASLPLDPKTTRGQFDGTFTYRTKLSAEYDPKLASVDVAARVENFSADHIVGKEKLESATLTVNVAAGVTHVAGTGKILGAPATLELTRNGEEPGQGMIAFSLDEAARAKAGLPFGATVAGPMGVKITGQVGTARPQAQIELDLTKTGLNYPAPGLFKPPGRAAKASFAYREDERGGASLDQIVYEGSGQMARGAMQLGADSGLVSAKFGQVRFSPGDSLEVEVTKTGVGLKINARGAAVDARPFLKSIAESGESGHSQADFDLDMAATLMSGANRQLISNAELHMSRKGGRLQALDFSGKQGGDELKGALSHADGGAPLLRVTTSDGGALLAFLDLYSHMEGGRLTCDLRVGEAGISGPLDIENFTLRGEPAMRSFANAPNNEQFATKFKIDPNVVSFRRLHALLDKKNGRLTVRDGTISSPNIGSTLEGWIDFDRDSLDLNGVFVPAYGVNNLFGQLPVLGLVLGGGDQEGLIGLNYRVTGKPSAPVLSVNPLSAIAPGFLRKIFGVLPP
jgi:hypothetical protein